MIKRVKITDCILVSETSVVLRPTDKHEIKEIISGLNINKSPGYIQGRIKA